METARVTHTHLIADAMKNRHLSRSDLGKLAKVDKSTLRRVLVGESVGTGYIQNVADALGLSYEHLVSPSSRPHSFAIAGQLPSGRWSGKMHSLDDRNLEAKVSGHINSEGLTFTSTMEFDSPVTGDHIVLNPIKGQLIHGRFVHFHYQEDNKLRLGSGVVEYDAFDKELLGFYAGVDPTTKAVTPWKLYLKFIENSNVDEE